MAMSVISIFRWGIPPDWICAVFLLVASMLLADYSDLHPVLGVPGPWARIINTPLFLSRGSAEMGSRSIGFLSEFASARIELGITCQRDHAFEIALFPDLETGIYCYFYLQFQDSPEL